VHDSQRRPAQHLASWAGLCPGSHESAGKRKSGKIRKGSLRLRCCLCQAAWAVSTKKNNYLSALASFISSAGGAEGKQTRDHRSGVQSPGHRLLHSARPDLLPRPRPRLLRSPEPRRSVPALNYQKARRPGLQGDLGALSPSRLESDFLRISSQPFRAARKRGSRHCIHTRASACDSKRRPPFCPALELEAQ